MSLVENSSLRQKEGSDEEKQSTGDTSCTTVTQGALSYAADLINAYVEEVRQPGSVR